MLAMGTGALLMAVLAIIADHSTTIRKALTFYTPAGPLSGVTTSAIVVWIACWIGFDLRWKRNNVSDSALLVGLYMLALSFLLMFPPIGHMF